MRSGHLAFLAASLFLPSTMPVSAQGVSASQTATATIPASLDRRARELVPILNGEGDPQATFAKAFLVAVPQAKLRDVAASVATQLGKATGIVTITPRDAHRAEVLIAYERGTAHAVVVLAPDASAQVTGFLIDRLEPADIAALRSLDQVAQALAALPGFAGFIVSDTEAGSEPQAQLDPDRPLAIGSTFKLVILAELVRAIDAGERKWSDTVTLGQIELPAGGFNRLAPGTRVTLKRLAEEMISVSDNSATDLLLQELGRARVEGMLGPVGFRHADANVPFLSTLELFKLKGIDGGGLGRRYLALSAIERRRMLDGEVARLPGSAIDRLYAHGRPVMIDSLEWFASPTDLVRVMGWFARHADTAAGAEALRILAINPGPARAVRERFGYLGYKGGSEPGVISETVLVRDKVARWKVVSATWNDPVAPVDEFRFTALVARALAILADQA
jgi:beta-lactamase class A